MSAPLPALRPWSRDRTAAPAARRSTSGSNAASLPSAAAPMPTAAISGAASLPPDGILVTSPASPVAPRVASVCASAPPSASSTSLVPETGTAPFSCFMTPMTTASAAARWGEASLMCNVIPTASMLVPARALLAGTGRPVPGTVRATGTAPWPMACGHGGAPGRDGRGHPVCAVRSAATRSALAVDDRRQVHRGRALPGRHRQLDRAEVRAGEIEHGHEVADRGPGLRHVGLGGRVRQVVLAVGGQRAQAPVGLDELQDRHVVVVGVVHESLPCIRRDREQRHARAVAEEAHRLDVPGVVVSAGLVERDEDRGGPPEPLVALDRGDRPRDEVLE